MKRRFKIYNIKIFDENVRTKYYKKPREKFIYGKK